MLKITSPNIFQRQSTNSFHDSEASLLPMLGIMDFAVMHRKVNRNGLKINITYANDYSEFTYVCLTLFDIDHFL